MNLRKVVVADDHDIFNIGLKISIEKDKSYQVIKEAQNGEEVLEFVKLNDTDLLICDYLLPGIDGVQTLRKAKKIKPKIRTILISSLEKFELQTLCEMNKIDAYIFKSKARNKIIEVANIIFQNLTFRPIQTAKNNPLIQLTTRELEILRFWILGKSLNDTGQHFKMSAKTVETHRTNIKKKFPSLSKEKIFELMKEHSIY